VRLAKFAIILVTTFGSFSFPGCGSEGNTVIQPANVEPTPEETAEYEKELEAMRKERG
jgi:hypothetical protein